MLEAKKQFLRHGELTYDLEGVGDDADSHQLLAVVAAVHHQRVGQSLDDGAVGLAESLNGVSASGVGDIDGISQGNVVTISIEKKSNPSAYDFIHVSTRKKLRCVGVPP